MSKSLEGVLVKKAHSKMNYTPEQIQEFVKCADPITGAIYFMDRFFNIQHPTKGKMIYHPFEYQKELINTYHNYRFSISLMPRQTGKALSIDTPILTPTGFKSLEEIKVGDTVYGQDGIKTQVTMATEIMYEHDCYKVTFDNGDTIIADSDHLWQVSCSNWRKDYKILTTSDIISYLDKSNKPYIVINHPIDNLDQSLPVDPYLLGVWLGDGGTRDPRITTHVNDLQNYIDNNIVEKICEYSKKFDTIRTFTIPGGRKTLTENGLYGNKHIPEIYFTASYNQRLSLLQGLMDTDGSIDKRGGRCEFYQKNLKLIDQVRTLLSTLGIKSRKHFKIINNEKYWTVGFKTDLPVFRLERKLKYIQKNKHPKNKRIYIYSIEKVDSVPVKCIQVDNNDHLFLAGKSLIPTHNSTSAAGYLLWYGMFKPDSTILIAAHKYSGAQEIMQRIRYAYELCPDHIRAGVTSYNKGSIEFDNGSRIVAQATTENTGRGMSITLLYCDEFAFVRPTIAKEFWTSISPTLSTGGKAIITSTPNSDEDQFALIWKQANKTEDEFGNETELGINGFRAYRSYWRDHPDRDDKWAEEERGRIGEERFRREMDCEFIINDETLINATTLVDMEGIEPTYKTGQVRWYKEPQPGRVYVVALDPSLGTGGDPAAIQVFEANTTTQIAEWKHNKTPIPTQIRILNDIVKSIYDKTQDGTSIYYSIENNTIGEAALISLAEFGEDNFPGMMLSEPKSAGTGRRFRKGFNTTNKSKISACAKLKNLVETKKMTVNSKSLISEFKTFVAHGTSYAAKIGETDDLVMATVLAVRMMQVLQNYHAELNTQIADFGDEEIPPMPFILF